MEDSPQAEKSNIHSPSRLLARKPACAPAMSYEGRAHGGMIEGRTLLHVIEVKYSDFFLNPNEQLIGDDIAEHGDHQHDQAHCEE
jgi:hypothetical protein